jgi:hypothetical protein
MKPFDPRGDDPAQWRTSYASWKVEVARAMAAQKTALAAYNSALSTANQLTAWRDELAGVLTAMRDRAASYTADNATLARLESQLADLDGQLADHETARDTATSRLLAGPGTDRPVVLLPVRVHTAWLEPTTLAVRILPSELSVDRHDPRLTPLELTLGQAYWATRTRPGDDQARQAWADLTRRLTPQRALWVVRATDPSAPSTPQQRDELDTAVTVRLLPDRFAVVLLAQGEPVAVTSSTGPSYVTWTEPVPAAVVVPLLSSPGSPAWTTDLQAAVQQGLAVRVTVPAGSPPIDELVVVGVRSGSGADDLAGLLRNHIYGAGIELLPGGTATNNSEAARTASGARHDAAALEPLHLGDGTTALPPVAAGRAAARLLGLGAEDLATVPGAAVEWGTVADAMGTLVRAAADGTLTSRYGTSGATAPELRPGGHAPALRVGRQPFGILAALDATRWQPTGKTDAPFAAAVADTAARNRSALDVDPSVPAPSAPAPRRATRDDDSLMPAIVAESSASTAWSSAGGSWAGLEGVIGPVSGPGSPATYLSALAQGPATSEAVQAATGSVLGAVALTAVGTPGAQEALTTLAAVAGREDGRQALATALGEHLDALSHRGDAWVTAAAAQRRAALTGEPVVGAYGYVTDVAPRPPGRPRSFGHVLAPSLGHAATAAVLRSAYLGQRRAAWAAELADATAAGDRTRTLAAEAGLATLAPLDPTTESLLPLAVDLSSRRVRQARWVLQAVRDGQPLAAVLGQQFERSLVGAGLQRYLAAFRKLTRFTAGTELEALEAARRSAADAVAAAQSDAAVALAAEEQHRPLVAAAQGAADAAAQAYTQATKEWAPFQAQLDERDKQRGLAEDAKAQLAALLASPPATTSHTHTVNVP